MIDRGDDYTSPNIFSLLASSHHSCFIQGLYYYIVRLHKQTSYWPGHHELHQITCSSIETYCAKMPWKPQTLNRRIALGSKDSNRFYCLCYFVSLIMCSFLFHFHIILHSFNLKDNCFTTCSINNCFVFLFDKR